MRLVRAMAGAVVAPAMEDALSIVEVKVWPLREPVCGRRYTVVRLRAKSGLAGFGECDGLDADDARFAAEALTGQPATAVAALAMRLRGRTALSAAVNVAALDLAARFARVPLHQYLGGPTRYKARAMTRLEGDAEGELTASLQRAQAAGYRAFMAPLASRDAKQRMEALRAAAGPEADFVIERSGALSLREAAGLCRDFERLHPYWFDEPCPASNLSGAKRLASESLTPLGFGRDLTEAARFEELLREEAVDVVRPAISLHGISGVRKLAAMAETRYVAVAPWHDGGPVGTAAALHLAASLPNFFIQQVPFPTGEADRAMRVALATPELEKPQGGFLPLPTGEGLGITPDVKELERYGEVSR